MSTATNTPFGLFFDQLRSVYSLEIQICESMPRLLPDLLRVPRAAFVIALTVVLITLILVLERFAIR